MFFVFSARNSSCSTYDPKKTNELTMDAMSSSPFDELLLDFPFIWTRGIGLPTNVGNMAILVQKRWFLRISRESPLTTRHFWCSQPIDWTNLQPSLSVSHPISFVFQTPMASWSAAILCLLFCMTHAMRQTSFDEDDGMVCECKEVKSVDHCPDYKITKKGFPPGFPRYYHEKVGRCSSS